MKKNIFPFLIILVFFACSFTSVTTYDSYLNYDKLEAKNCVLNDENLNLLTFVNSIDFDRDEIIVGDYYKIYSNVNLEYPTKSNFDQIILHYNLDDDNLNYDALLIVIKNGQIKPFYFKETNKEDVSFLLFSIKRFVINTLLDFDFEQNNSIDVLASSNNETTFVPYESFHEQINVGTLGYFTIDVDYSVYKANDASSLYLVHAETGFTPGSVCRENGDKTYENVKNARGYVHMTVSKAYDATESYAYPFRYGNTPYYKDFWPTSSTSTVTITSSITPGLELGFSTEKGFASSEAYKESGFDLTGSISYTYSKSITTDEPRVSAQTYNKSIEYTDRYNSKPNQTENVVEGQWSYKYSKDTSITYWQDSYYLFELSSGGKDLFVGDFRLTFDLKMVVDRGLLWAEKEAPGSLDLVCRPSYYGVKQSIYHFSNGMI